MDVKTNGDYEDGQEGYLMWSIKLWSSDRQPAAALTVILAIACLAIPLGLARADDSPAPTLLTLDEAIETALSRNAELGAARASLDIARAQVRAARAKSRLGELA